MFETLVGQNLVKKKLQFYKESYDTSKRMPFLFFVGAKGLGKTEFAKQLAKEIKNTEYNWILTRSITNLTRPQHDFQCKRPLMEK